MSISAEEAKDLFMSGRHSSTRTMSVMDVPPSVRSNCDYVVLPLGENDVEDKEAPGMIHKDTDPEHNEDEIVVQVAQSHNKDKCEDVGDRPDPPVDEPDPTGEEKEKESIDSTVLLDKEPVESEAAKEGEKKSDTEEDREKVIAAQKTIKSLRPVPGGFNYVQEEGGTGFITIGEAKVMLTQHIMNGIKNDVDAFVEGFLINVKAKGHGVYMRRSRGLLADMQEIHFGMTYIDNADPIFAVLADNCPDAAKLEAHTRKTNDVPIVINFMGIHPEVTKADFIVMGFSSGKRCPVAACDNPIVEGARNAVTTHGLRYCSSKCKKGDTKNRKKIMNVLHKATKRLSDLARI